jgi:uncharacterized protein YlzI (FlbEa/FlbD family)
MIRLIRCLDNLEILLNADQIRSYAEEGSVTRIMLNDGEVLDVKNQVIDIQEKIEAWQKGMAEDPERTEIHDPDEA